MAGLRDAFAPPSSYLACMVALSFFWHGRHVGRSAVYPSCLLADAMKKDWLFLLLLAVLLLPSITFAGQGQGVPLTIGMDADPCVAAGTCDNVDVVQAQLITQDVIVYGVACFLFFFGFQVGLGFMLGAIHRQGGYRE